ncbi:MAG: pyridoxamine 5'-phosphate oxidase family protein [Myxococcota bacterium]
MTKTDEIEIPAAHREILAATHHGVMSTIRASDGLISTNPVGYVWDGACVRISTIKDRIKYRNLLANPSSPSA